jgi:hypothetical protein
VKDPTAVQTLLDVHDTPFSSLGPPVPRGLSVGWIAHRDPFQPSASVLLAEPSVPTATQAFVVAHDTWLSWDVSPPRLGVLCVDHLVPCRRSTTATVSPAESMLAAPTAVHAVADEQDTPQSQSPIPNPGWEVRSTDHRLPFQRAAPDPTATHAVADAHDTSLRPLGLPRWSAHLDPFHRPTDEPPPKNPRIPSVYAPPPTAMQAVLDVHDTPVALKPFGIR